MKKEVFAAAPSLFEGISIETAEAIREAKPARKANKQAEKAAFNAYRQALQAVAEEEFPMWMGYDYDEMDVEPLMWLVAGTDFAIASPLDFKIEAYTEAEAIAKAFEKHGRSFDVTGVFSY